MELVFLAEAFNGKQWFWTGFWPNLAATIFGVAVGIPIGLWLNRRAERAASIKAKSDAKELMLQGLVAVQSALLHNRHCLVSVQERLSGEQAVIDDGLDLSA